jgi:glycosyltransferase involved in cell wall biosynthesis
MKDHPTFLAAAHALAAKRGDVRFVCIGDGPPRYRESLKRRAAELGLTDRLIWAGHRSDMPAVYGAFDVLVSSSAFGEGFPNVVAEAMACGTPCVVTDVGDSAEVVGDLGRVVPPGDAPTLAEAVGAVLDGPPADPDRLHARVEREFSVTALVERTERALQALGKPS